MRSTEIKLEHMAELGQSQANMYRIAKVVATGRFFIQKLSVVEGELRYVPVETTRDFLCTAAYPFTYSDLASARKKLESRQAVDSTRLAFQGFEVIE